MPIPLLAIGAGIVAAAGLAKSYIGARQANKAAKMAANNTRPNFDIADEYYTNQSLAQNQAQSGLGQDSLDYYSDQASRGLTQSTDALLQAGGNPNAVAGLYDRYQQGIGGIAAANSQAKRQNLQSLMAANSDLAAQKTMQWSLDKYEPYKDTARTASALQAQGTENIFNGISQTGSAIGTMGQAGLFKSSGAGSGAQSNPDTAISTVNPSARVQPLSMGTGADTSGYDANSLIDDSMQGMENSPYRDLIRRRLQQDYNRVNQRTVG